jgi:hypothetical protein
MAEAVAVIGLVATIGQLVDFGTKIIKRLDEFQSDIDQVPQTFRDIKNQLPLLLNTLQRTKAQAEAGDIDEDTQKAILSVVEGCRAQVQSLNDTLVKTFPAKGDSKWRRGVKVFRSVSQEKDVQQIVESLQTYVSTLTYHQAAGSPKVLSGRTKPLFTVPFERDPHFIPRSDILEQVDQKLKAHRRVALAGIGGVGQVPSRTRQRYTSRPLAMPLTECDPQ